MDEQTCGKGLAEQSSLPAFMAELIAALAENLEIHMQALDLTDPRAKKEHEAYARVAVQSRDIAQHLRATAEGMAGYRDLPMGRHDEEAMIDPQVAHAFEKFVKREEALASLLRQALERDQKMLVQVRAQAAGGARRMAMRRG
jgi:hypothetical protein